MNAEWHIQGSNISFFFFLAAVSHIAIDSADSQSPTGYDKAGDSVSDLCGELRYNMGLTKIFESEADSIIQQVQKSTEEAAAYRLATLAQNSHKTKLGLTALAIRKQEILQSRIAKALDAATKKREAASALAARRARLISLRQLQVSKPALGTASHEASGDSYMKGSSTHGIKMDLTLQPTAENNCTTAKLNDGSGPKQSEISHATITKMKILPETVFAQPTINLQVGMKGTPTSGSASNYDTPGLPLDGQGTCTTHCLGAKATPTAQRSQTPTDQDLFTEATTRSKCKTHDTNK
uniref:Variant surface glycoprotein 1125.1536 n=1 Tax=Trypanosoma brucei TaxID=5691 RepID=A0A1J0R7F3_9TRYP|nr:variant surface glycoprotein 1125.1536 [Trypanosoma brucei]